MSYVSILHAFLVRLKFARAFLWAQENCMYLTVLLNE